MALVLSRLSHESLPIDLVGLTPTELAELDISQIEALPIRHGKELVALADLFRVSGRLDDAKLIIEGDLDSACNLGARLSDGILEARGNVGPGAGRGMTGGRLLIRGSAGFGLGASMQGGEIRVAGNVGEDCGGIDAGARVGMRGGMILVDGNAGDHLARSIRRGTVAVRGSCGAGAMRDAVAGTALIGGACGPRPGIGMRRGTLFLLGEAEVPALPTFRIGRAFRPPFWNLLLDDFARRDWPIAPVTGSAGFATLHGDLLTLGLGEIFVAMSQ